MTENKIKTYKYPDDFINKIICGDCLELIKSIPDKKIDCVITDPPYGLNKNGIKFLGHCYVKESEYTLKEEKEWIKKDTEKVKLIYRKGKYRNKLAN